MKLVGVALKIKNLSYVIHTNSVYKGFNTRVGLRMKNRRFKSSSGQPKIDKETSKVYRRYYKEGSKPERLRYDAVKTQDLFSRNEKEK